MGDKTVAWSAHYGLATLAGLTGDGPELVRHVGRGEKVADELQSPLLRAHLNEVSMQYLFASGKWDGGIAVAEATISACRALNQRTLLPRVMTWATTIHIARGEYDIAKRYMDEAWDIAVARAAKGRPIEVHSQIVDYTGMAAYHLAIGEWQRAIEVGEQGLAIVDQVGYTAWGVDRLLPVIGEAACWALDVARAQKFRERMEGDCKRLGHRLGLAWVAAGDGLIARLKNENEKAEALIRGAIEELDRVPWVYDSARLPRWHADVLIRLGRPEEGLGQLRRCQQV